jgi:hypothetical protein
MFRDNSLRKPETKARTRDFAGDIGFEKSRREVIRDAFSIVCDENVHPLAAAPHSNRDLPLTARESVHCIQDQVRQDL